MTHNSLSIEQVTTKEAPLGHEGYSQSTVDQRWSNFCATRDIEARNALVEQYFPIVQYNANRIWARLPDGVELDDLVSAGVFGLMDAIESYDRTRGVKFETYCVPRVRGAMLDELRTMDWVPRLVRSKASKVREAVERCMNRFGHPPKRDELAEELGLSFHELETLLREANAVTITSIDKTHFETDSNKEISTHDLVASDEAGPSDRIEQADFWRAALKGLNRTERLIIILYYREKKTMKEIGAELGLSESRVSQMHSAIIFSFIPRRALIHKRLGTAIPELPGA